MHFLFPDYLLSPVYFEVPWSKTGKLSTFLGASISRGLTAEAY